MEYEVLKKLAEIEIGNGKIVLGIECGQVLLDANVGGRVHAVKEASKYCHHPGPMHMKGVDRSFAYLRSTKN